LGNNQIVGGRDPGRNEPCPCGSGLKAKDCHYSDEKRQAVQKFANAFMARLIARTKMEKNLIPWPFTCHACGKGFEMPKPSAIAPGQALCPYCDSTNITQTTAPESEAGPTIIQLGDYR
jgi:predicted Zn-ribbon and HTH transcriptional regulator